MEEGARNIVAKSCTIVANLRPITLMLAFLSDSKKASCVPMGDLGKRLMPSISMPIQRTIH